MANDARSSVADKVQVQSAGARTPATFSGEQYTIRRKVFKLFGAAFHLLNQAGEVVGYSKQKAFKLKEDIRLYTDDTLRKELLVIKARKVIDFSATFDIFDPGAGNQSIGSLRRKGLKSTFIRDEWLVFSPDGREIGLVQEESSGLGFLRRFIELAALLVPQKFKVMAGQTQVAQLRTHFNPFVYRLSVSMTADAAKHLDPRLVIAASILIAAIEGRQN